MWWVPGHLEKKKVATINEFHVGRKDSGKYLPAT